MSSTLLMKCLFVAYLLIMLVAIHEKNWPRALYWFGAAVLTVAVLWGTK